MTNAVKKESIWALYNQERQRKNNYHFSIEDIKSMFADEHLFWVVTSGNYVYCDNKIYQYDYRIFDCNGNVRTGYSSKSAISEYELHRLAGKKKFSLRRELRIRFIDWYSQLSESTQKKLDSTIGRFTVAVWKPVAHSWISVFDDVTITKVNNKLDLDSNSELKQALGQFRMYEKELKDVPVTFSKALKYHMDQRAVSSADLSKMLKVSPVQISYLVNESEDEVVRHTPKMIVAICVALNLSPTLSLNLLELAGCSLLNNRKERVYRYIVDFLYNQSLDFVDEFLIENDMQPLRKQD